MKLLNITLSAITLIAFQTVFSQTEENKVEKEIKTDNFMDLQTQSMTKIFGSDLSGNPDGKSIGYLELLDQMDVSPEQKAKLRKQYYIQCKTLTQKQQDSLGVVLVKNHKEAQAEQIKN